MRKQSSRNILIAFALICFLFSSGVGADTLGELAHTLRTSKREKSRISAAISLGRLHDKRAVKTLVFALKKDRSQLVRAVSAAALGHIGDPRALPALREAAKDDVPAVSKRASEALLRIEKARDDRQVASGRLSPGERDRRAQAIRVAARERPAYAEPKMFVQLKSVADKSQRKATKSHRAWAADTLRGYMTSELKRRADVTLDDKAADDLGIRRFAVDVTITDFNRRVRGPYVEIQCNVRLAVSNQRGRMLSFLTGGAAVQVPKHTFKTKYEPQLRKEALENAAKSMHQDLMTYLEKEMRL